jgi:hypothetical protein
LPRRLVEQLQDYAGTGEAQRIYKANFSKAKVKRPAPERTLLHVPTQTDRCFKIDLKAAGIPKDTPKGKLDFHALRTTYINLIMDTGLTLKDA